MPKLKVLIVGGGFGGAKTALELSDDSRFHVTLLSNLTDLRYYPTLYHAATGGKVANSAIPLHRLFEGHEVKVVYGQAAFLDRQNKTIKTTDEQILDFDVLVLALGAVTNYFNIAGLAEYAYGIKSIEEAQMLKHHLHQQLVDERHPDLNYVIVGAGPTGIELAGAMPHYLRYVMKNHKLRDVVLHIDLVEAAPRLLPRLPRDTSRIIKRRLQKLGIKLYLGQAVQGETADSLQVNGKAIQSHTVIWTAGVTNNPFFKDNGFLINKAGKIAVDVYLQAEPNIYVIGDNANTPYSGMAQTAIHDGIYIANNLKRLADNKQPESYSVKRPITIIPVGEHWAAVLWGSRRIYGWLGWVLRELADLIGFHDYESWPQAARQWTNELNIQPECMICAEANQKT